MPADTDDTDDTGEVGDEVNQPDGATDADRPEVTKDGTGSAGVADPSGTTGGDGQGSGQTYGGNGGSVSAAVDDGVSIQTIIRTTVWCAFVAAGGHIVLWIGYIIRNRSSDGFTWAPWQPVVGIALATIAVISFGGFYAASRRARVAIASSFLLTFLVLLSYELSLSELAAATLSDNSTDANAKEATAALNGANALLTDLRSYVGVIIAFYFGSEAVIAGTKAIGTAISSSPDQARSVQTSDRDLATQVPVQGAHLGQTTPGGFMASIFRPLRDANAKPTGREGVETK